MEWVETSDGFVAEIDGLEVYYRPIEGRLGIDQEGPSCVEIRVSGIDNIYFRFYVYWPSFPCREDLINAPVLAEIQQRNPGTGDYKVLDVWATKFDLSLKANPEEVNCIMDENDIAWMDMIEQFVGSITREDLDSKIEFVRRLCESGAT